MNEVYTAALDLQTFVQAHEWPFCFIGGLAVQRWGRPRATKDADMTLLTRFDRDEECISALARHFPLMFAESVEFAATGRVLFLKHPNGVRLDVALGALEFEEHAVARASWWDCSETARPFTCSADDLVVYKAYLPARRIGQMSTTSLMCKATN